MTNIYPWKVEEEGETTALIIQQPVKHSEEAENDLQRIKKKYELLVKKLRDKVREAAKKKFFS